MPVKQALVATDGRAFQLGMPSMLASQLPDWQMRGRIVDAPPSAYNFFFFFFFFFFLEIERAAEA